MELQKCSVGIGLNKVISAVLIGFATFSLLFHSFILLIGAARKLGRSHALASQTRVARSISVKDIIAVLEREPQMCKTPLIHRLYEKIHSDAPAEQG